MNEGLDRLREKRRNWVLTNRENNFEDGIKRLLTDLYPDNAHFIYELLQNAEDTAATTVRFTLTKSELQFEHNGKRMFNLADVESITGIGDSTKKDDQTKVGKFGVGFKAVFAYTTTPEIHSGDYHFRIRDLVVPDATGVTRTLLDEDRTRFVFPLDHPDKPSSVAVAEISQALRELGASTLLFLNHIRIVEYLLPDGALGTVDRADRDDASIQINHCAPDGKVATTRWLLFGKPVELPRNQGLAHDYRVAIAYALGDDTEGKKGAKRAVRAVEPGRVCIYFPAEKETSNLRFHLHAPFASTVARDSVRDCAENRSLRDALAQLVAESLASIRRMGLLTVDFLAVLPNPDDNLSAFYEPIRERIVEAFKEQPLVPTRSGTFARVEVLYQGPGKIADVIGDDELSVLTNYAPPLWAANAPQQNQRPGRFIDSLEIEPWGWDELESAVSALDSDKQAVVEQLVVPKDDSWLRRFYALLGEAWDEHTKLVNVGGLRIIRVSAHGKDEHVLPSGAYFAPEPSTSPPPGVKFVKQSVYTNPRSKQQEQFARSFLESARVRPFDETAEMKRVLEKYGRDPDIPSSRQARAKHVQDVRSLIDAREREILLPGDFEDSPFILGVDDWGDEVWCKPDELVIDEPYQRTGLAELRDAHKRSAVSPIYAEVLPKKTLGAFTSFLFALGAMLAIEVTETSTGDNPRRDELREDYFKPGVRRTDSAIDEDYTIEGIDEYLAQRSPEVSHLLWNALIGASLQSAKARFRPNRTYETREADSQVVQHLKQAAWIPDAAGKLRKPCDCTRDDLPKKFPYDDSNGMLTAIGFGSRAREQDAAYQARSRSAKELGFTSADEAQKVATALRETGASSGDLVAFIRSCKTVSMPQSRTSRPARRAAKVGEYARNAPDRESVSRERAIDPSTNRIILEAKAYLRGKYTNDDDQLGCQCCQREMPFKVNGEYYFEAVQCLRNLDKHYYQNRLALCPTCAAMYHHARSTDDDMVSQRICNARHADGAPSVSIEVDLAGKTRQLYFVGAHWFDLRTVVKNER